MHVWPSGFCGHLLCVCSEQVKRGLWMTCPGAGSKASYIVTHIVCKETGNSELMVSKVYRGEKMQALY